MKKILSILLVTGLVASAYAQDTNKTDTSDGVKVSKFINDMKMTGRIQMRGAYLGSHTKLKDRMLSQDDLSGGTTVSGADRGYSEFALRRLRLGVKGKVNKNWSYVIDMKLENELKLSNKKGLIQEATFGYKFNLPLKVRFGSMKVPFMRENLTSSSRLMGLERSVVTNKIGHQMDLGVQANGHLLNKKITYGVGIFNGSGGFPEAQKDKAKLFGGGRNESFFYAGRIQFDPMGEYKNGKSMFSKSTLLSFGLASWYQDRLADSGTNAGAENAWGTNQVHQAFSWTLDAAFQMDRLNIKAAYARGSGKEFYSANNVLSNDKNGALSGYYAQVAYFIMPSFLQAWLRYETYSNAIKQKEAKITGTGTVDLSQTKYLSFGANFYLVDKHKIKGQLAYHYGLNKGTGLTAYEDLGIKDDWFGAQIQLSF